MLTHDDEHAAVGGGVGGIGTGSAEHGIHVDDATGNMYYVNSATGETVWCGDEDVMSTGRVVSVQM
jgi:hypothetical protein